ncbi:transposase [Streptomyces mirabilis]|uniref:transposase n=1 Tax=Streptomyces mirabilis TaxID=68239 RepID=UPI0036AC3B59
MERGDLTNGQWIRLESLLPQGVKASRPPLWTRRQLIDGMRWRTRTGAPWRDVPERYGSWDRVYDLFRRWQRDGTWAQIVTRLQAEADAKGLITWDVSVDSTVCRAHQHAAGAAKRGISCRSWKRSGCPDSDADAPASARTESARTRHPMRLLSQAAAVTGGCAGWLKAMASSYL